MRSRLLFILLMIALAAMVGCSGSQSTSPTSSAATPAVAPAAAPATSPSAAANPTAHEAAPAVTEAPAGTTIALSRPSRSSRGGGASVVQVTLGDDPSDHIASLSITINNITLISTTGTPAVLLSAPTTVEIAGLAGTTTPLATVTVPAGTYNKAAIALGGATVTYVDASGATVQKTFPPPLLPFKIFLNPAFISDGSALVINLDLDLHASVGFDTTGALTFNPLFIATHGRLVGPIIGVPPNPFTGGVERVMGTVTGVSAPNFTIKTIVGQRTLKFTTNDKTIWKGISGIDSLQTGMLVMVGGQAQGDGTLLALGVMIVDGLRTGVGAVGIVAKTTGTPVTQFVLLAHGITPLMAGMTPVPQVALTINVTNTTDFEPDADDIPVDGFTFDANTLSPAQHVGVNASATLTATTTNTTTMGSLPLSGTLTAARIRLLQQPVTGTISNLTATSFTLTTPADGVFAKLAGTNTITVYRFPRTQVKDDVTLADGQKVVVRGLLFNNSGYKMLAKWIVVLQ